MRTIAAVLLSILLAFVPVLAQDGTIVAREVVEFTESQPSWIMEGHLQHSNLPLSLDKIKVQRITYLSDGLRVKGYLIEPTTGQSLPAAIFNRGGFGSYFTLDDRAAVLSLGPLAQHGYVVVASQYRGNAGGEGYDQGGGADVNDVLNLIPLLESHPRVDSRRIGMVGWSRGGMMTFLALTRTDRIRAAVVAAHSGDLSADLESREEFDHGALRQYLARLIPGYDSDPEEALRNRSAVYWADRLHKATPILYLHGSADWRSYPKSAIRMAERLHETKHPFRFVLLEGADHGMTQHIREVDRQVAEWFDRYVRDGEAPPKVEPHGN